MQNYEIKTKPKTRNSKKDKIFYLKDNGDNRDNFFYRRTCAEVLSFLSMLSSKKNSVVVIKDIISPFFN